MTRRPSPKTFVLVHGTWLGGWIWTPTVDRLKARGHRVFAPTLTGCGERVHLSSPDIGLETHIQDIVGVIEAEELTDVILVGHSFSGIAATGAADRLQGRIRRIVFFDALVPRPGRMSGVPKDPATGEPAAYFKSRMPGFIDGYRMDFFKDYPIAMLTNPGRPDIEALIRRRVTTHPMRCWTDELTLLNGGWTNLPRTYLHAAAQIHSPSSDAMPGPAKGGEGWDWLELPIDRLGMLNAPEIVAPALEGLT
jgi:pimeloyl-ACP methyl ester carboxylesterase